MQSLKLADDLFPLLLNTKFSTIRFGRRDIQLGELTFENVSDSDSKVVNVIRVVHSKVHSLMAFEITDDGFKNINDLIEGMKRFYPDIDRQSEVTVIEFE